MVNLVVNNLALKLEPTYKTLAMLHNLSELHFLNVLCKANNRVYPTGL